MKSCRMRLLNFRDSTICDSSVFRVPTERALILKMGIMKLSKTLFLVNLTIIIGFCTTLTGCVSSPTAPEQIVRVHMSDRSLQSVIGWAELKQNDAVHDLCYRYRYGHTAPLDYDNAFKWCSIAAESHNSSSQVLLAELYWNGYGTQPNKAKAVELYKTAADQGHEHAQLVMSHLYRDGDGVLVDHDLSIKYLKMSADAGYSKAIAEMKQYQPSYEYKAIPDQEERSREPNSKTIRLQAKEGFFSQEFYRLTPGVRWKIKMRLHPLKEISSWAPLQSLCISAEGPSDFFCLVFNLTALDSDRLSGELRTIPADQRVVLQKNPLDGSFDINQDIKVELNVQGQGIFFSINGELAKFQHLGFNPQIWRTLCSTAECDFAMEVAPLDRPN